MKEVRVMVREVRVMVKEVRVMREVMVGDEGEEEVTSTSNVLIVACINTSSTSLCHTHLIVTVWKSDSLANDDIIPTDTDTRGYNAVILQFVIVSIAHTCKMCQKR